MALDGFLPVAIDFESTGFSHTRDRIVQVGAVAALRGRMLFELGELVQTPVKMSPGARAVTGISDADLRGKPDFKTVFEILLARIDEALAQQAQRLKVLLVAHNGNQFDFRKLIYEMHRHGISLATLRTRDVHLCDTLAAAKKVNGSAKGMNTQAALFKQVTGTEMQGAHDALVDCRALVRIFNHPPFQAALTIESLDAFLSRAGPTLRGLDLFCPKCKGNVWDNRTYNEHAAVKRPDLSCEDRERCEWVLWNAEPGRASGPAVQDPAAVAAPAPASAPAAQAVAAVAGGGAPPEWGVCKKTKEACKRCVARLGCRWKGKPGHAPAAT